MKIRHALWLSVLLTFPIIRAPAATLYVDLNSTNPVPPYASWSTAATNIQDAVDASTNGDLILVTNGVYQAGGRLSSDGASNRVVVADAMTLQSVNGQTATLIDGGNTMRCVYLTNGAVLSGFTVADGNVTGGLGGGIYCASTNAIVENCLVISNSSLWGGGAYNGTLENCTLSFNSAGDLGGGAMTCVLNSCILSNNFAASKGGAAAVGWFLNNCLMVGNYAAGGGGGVYAAVLNNCLVISNGIPNGGNNPRSRPTQLGGGTYGCNLNNCTVVGNSAGGGGGVCLYAELVNLPFSVNNCIIYYNSAGTGANIFTNGSSTPITNCCTLASVSGQCITNDPAFVNPATGDFHLSSNSPCINAGNNAYVASTMDLDGNPRIQGGTVDIGAYEYQTPVNQISYAWLEQYGLPITTNTDTADPDGDGMNNYQEWIAGTDPTNALSLLEMLNPIATKNPAGIILSWESVSNRTYFLQSSTNLAAQPAFSTIQSNIVGQAGTTSYTDTGATNAGPFFYRVGVQ
jgi:Bacterial TSP3 repeat